jgi:hypothetical protein
MIPLGTDLIESLVRASAEAEGHQLPVLEQAPTTRLMPVDASEREAVGAAA